MGFSGHAKVQKTPVLIPDLKDIRQLAAGVNHVLALDGRGKVFAWGCGEQNQLGRRVFDNHPELALRPTSIGALPIRGAKAVRVACGSYHSFAVDEQGRVYAWGANNFGQLGMPDEAGESNASHLKPRVVESLRDYNIVSIAGGEHHSLASTTDGKLLTWGRIDGNQVGLRAEVFTPENTIFDERGNPRILKKPIIVPGELNFRTGALAYSIEPWLRQEVRRHPLQRLGRSRNGSQLCPHCRWRSLFVGFF